MATSEVSIVNSALAKLGAQRIVTLEDANERARIMSEQYEKIRDDLLYSHPWNFATRRVELAALNSPVPEYEFSSYFQLPADCLRVVGTDLYAPATWQIEGRYLAANADKIKIKYIKKVTDVTLFTPGFVEVLASKLAADTAYSITQSVTLRDQMLKEYMEKLRQSRSFDAQEGEGSRVYADSWLNSR